MPESPSNQLEISSLFVAQGIMHKLAAHSLYFQSIENMEV